VTVAVALFVQVLAGGLDAETQLGRGKTHAVGDKIFSEGKAGVFDFDDLLAVLADDVAGGRGAIDFVMLVGAALEIDFSQNAAFDQEREETIDRGQGNQTVLLPGRGQELLRLKGARKGQRRADDGFAGRRELRFFLAEEVDSNPVKVFVGSLGVHTQVSGSFGQFFKFEGENNFRVLVTAIGPDFVDDTMAVGFEVLAIEAEGQAFEGILVGINRHHFDIAFEPFSQGTQFGRDS